LKNLEFIQCWPYRSTCHRFSKDVDTEGVLQIYYKEEDKVFTPLEVEIAEMFSKRVVMSLL